MKTTPAIENLNLLVLEASKVRPPDETRRFLRQHIEAICNGLEDACRLGVSELGPSRMVYLLDSIKGICHRSLLVNRQLTNPISLTGDDVIIAFSDPSIIDSYFSSSDNATICFLYTARDGQTWVLAVAQPPGEKSIRAGQHELVSKLEGPRFL